MSNSNDLLKKNVLQSISKFLGETKEQKHQEIPKNEYNKQPKLQYFTRRLTLIIQGFAFRLVCLIFILMDLSIVIADLVQDEKNKFIHAFHIINMIFACIFLVEVSLRIFVVSWECFISHWYNIIDLIIVILTFLISFVDIFLDEKRKRISSNFRILILLRLVRLARIIRIFSEQKNIVKGARKLVSQNKKRYILDGFDLDLTYITDRIIAMSFPSSGCTSWYRNSITEVAKFLDVKHGGHYRVYNLCSESGYDTSYFHGRVRRFYLDDHNVPLVKEMWEFAKDVKNWLDKHYLNVVAVHCKGGKGRTGTMICILLIEFNILSNAKLCLDYFGQCRTDLGVGEQFQGVETPSQSRYVAYYEIMKMWSNMPDDHPLYLNKIVMQNLPLRIRKNDSNWYINLRQGRLRHLYTLMSTGNKNYDILELKVTNKTVLCGDIFIRFNSSSVWLNNT